MQQKGIQDKAVISWPELMAFKRTFTDPVPENKETILEKAGIAAYHGTATFISDKIIQVGDTQLEADQFVIAAGAKARRLQPE